MQRTERVKQAVLLRQLGCPTAGNVNTTGNVSATLNATGNVNATGFPTPDYGILPSVEEVDTAIGKVLSAFPEGPEHTYPTEEV